MMLMTDESYYGERNYFSRATLIGAMRSNIMQDADIDSDQDKDIENGEKREILSKMERLYILYFRKCELDRPDGWHLKMPKGSLFANALVED